MLGMAAESAAETGHKSAQAPWLPRGRQQRTLGQEQ
ncbi:hypothetical protein CBM2585_B50168 [Cupriavidus taiwanensis]|nr:hypothetical protein CBM2585_B50168 [Cupriavidus taiwanensis]